MRYILVFFIGLFVSCQQQTKTNQVSSDTFELDSALKQDVVFDNDTMVIYQIDSIDFYKFKTNASQQKDTLIYISDFKVVKQMLKGRVTFGGYNSESNSIDSLIDGEMVAFVRYNNGDTVNANVQRYFWDAGFIRYYPTEEILLMEGGHSSDFAIDLRSGSFEISIIGNPMYWLDSPSKKFRLNGWFPGQECSAYFIQEQQRVDYKTLAVIPMHLASSSFDFCTIKDVFWNTDNELYFRNFYYGVSDDPRLGFFKLVIKK